ncbi:hypothetical protein ACEWY4_020643 [Coilia grayii]|uniref:Cadherin domain-containing protein n=1 Tax=Coilia grayii TaxID=363190 RepID=A0ABD1J8H0_9TELE
MGMIADCQKVHMPAGHCGVFIGHYACSSVTQLQAVDPDGEPLIYGVVGEEAARYFAVEQNTGVVWLRQPLDRETKSEMQVEFSVSDSQGVVKDTVNIQIGDVNDNAPTFFNQPYTVHIPEVELDTEVLMTLHYDCISR